MENKLGWRFLFFINYYSFISPPLRQRGAVGVSVFFRLCFFFGLTLLNNTDFNHVNTLNSDPFNTEACSQHMHLI